MKRLFQLEFFACLGLLRIFLSCSQQIPSFTFFLCAPDNIIFPPNSFFPTEFRVPCTTAQSGQTSTPLLPAIEFA